MHYSTVSITPFLGTIDLVKRKDNLIKTLVMKEVAFFPQLCLLQINKEPRKQNCSLRSQLHFYPKIALQGGYKFIFLGQRKQAGFTPVLSSEASLGWSWTVVALTPPFLRRSCRCLDTDPIPPFSRICLCLIELPLAQSCFTYWWIVFRFLVLELNEALEGTTVYLNYVPCAETSAPGNRCGFSAN